MLSYSPDVIRSKFNNETRYQLHMRHFLVPDNVVTNELRRLHTDRSGSDPSDWSLAHYWYRLLYGFQGIPGWIEDSRQRIQPDHVVATPRPDLDAPIPDLRSREASGLIIGYGPDDLRGFGSRWPWLSDADIVRFCEWHVSRGQHFAWFSLSTGERPEHHEQTFQALKNVDRTRRIIKLMIDHGVQPLLEAGAQEYMVQKLDSNPLAMTAYIKEAVETFGALSPLVFPYREMNDLGKDWGHERHRHYAKMVAACAGDHYVGIHGASKWVPPDNVIGTTPDCVWLMHWKLREPVDEPWMGTDDDMNPRRWSGAAEWVEYVMQVKRRTKNLVGCIAFEHSNGGYPAAGPLHSESEARARGRHFLGVDSVWCDLSGGAKVEM